MKCDNKTFNLLSISNQLPTKGNVNKSYNLIDSTKLYDVKFLYSVPVVVVSVCGLFFIYYYMSVIK